MDEEVGERRREGAKTETVTVRKGQQRQRASVREDEKQKKEVEKYAALFLGGGTAPVVPRPSVRHL